MANPRNEAAVADLREQLAGVSTFFVVDYQGLSAGDMNRLRSEVRKAGGHILVAKNTLINVVLKEQDVEGLDETLTGPTALVLVGSDPVGPVKALTEFAKDHPQELPKAKGGLMQGSVVGSESFERIAKLPSEDELKAQLVGVLTAPMQELVGVLSAPQRDFATVVSNYADKLKEEG